MINTVLAVTAEAEELGGAFSAERWAYAGRMTLLGMVMVFLVLALLWGILAIFHLILSPKKPKAQAPQAIADAVSESATQAEPEEAVAETAEDDGELIAVIAAAVAAYRASEAPEGVEPGSFRVVSFRRAQSGHAWNSK